MLNLENKFAMRKKTGSITFHTSATPPNPFLFEKLFADRTFLCSRFDLMFVKNPRTETERSVPIADQIRMRNSKSELLRDLDDRYFFLLANKSGA